MLKKILVLLLAAIFTWPLLFGCGESTTGSKGQDVIRINTSRVHMAAVQVLIKAKGFLEPHLPAGKTVEWYSLETSLAIRDAIAAGRLDVSSMAAAAFIPAVENGLPFVILSAAVGPPTRFYSNSPHIKSLADIKESDRISLLGKESNTYLTFIAACQRELGQALVYDSNLVSILDTEALASLATSQEFAGALFHFPFMVKAEELPNLTMVEDFTPLMQELNITGFFVTNRDFFKNNPDLIEAFIKAQQDAIAFINSKPEEAAEVLAEYYGVAPEHVTWALKAMPPRMEITNYDTLADLMYEAKILSKPPTKFADLPKYGK